MLSDEEKQELLARALDANIEVEHLNLEDIFLEITK